MIIQVNNKDTDNIVFNLLIIIQIIIMIIEMKIMMERLFEMMMMNFYEDDLQFLKLEAI
jgi:hypothetical protein